MENFYAVINGQKQSLVDMAAISFRTKKSIKDNQYKEYTDREWCIGLTNEASVKEMDNVGLFKVYDQWENGLYDVMVSTIERKYNKDGKVEFYVILRQING